MHLDNTIASRSATFDPAAWLEAFAQVGGGYHFTLHGAVYIGWGSPNRSSEENAMAEAMLGTLTLIEKTAIEAHITETQRPDDAQTIVAQAWASYKRARLELAAIPDDEQDDEAECEKELWRVVDQAERVIEAAKPGSLRGIEIKIWLALSHLLQQPEDDLALFREDLKTLNNHKPTLDWSAKLLLGAINTLRSMEA